MPSIAKLLHLPPGFAVLAVSTTSSGLLVHYQVMMLPTPDRPPSHEIGLDEFSLRRGKRGQGLHYGTIIVDLQHHKIIDLLPDRDAATVAAWLSNRPSIHVVSRDRSGTFAQAITTALPAAQQVLDRFHLIQNARGFPYSVNGSCMLLERARKMQRGDEA